MKKREMTIFGRFKSIRDAMMLSFSVLVVVAVLIFLLIAMNFTKKTIYENSRTSTSQLISQVNYDIDSYIDYMENISWVAASGSDLSRYLFNQEQTPEEKEAAKERILTQFTTILESRSDIYNVAAVADNGEALINSGADRLNKYVDVRGEQPRVLSVATTNQRILRSVEDSQTATALHQLLSFGEAFRTVGHHATIIPVNFHFGHSHLRHILACGESQLHVLCLRSAGIEQ